MIRRDQYLNKLISFKDRDLIKIVTGIRRCGKSTLLELFREYLLDNGVDEGQIIAINFENVEYNHLLDFMELHKYVKERVQKGKKNYLFFDEIQNVPSFEKAINSLHLDKNIDIYLTGSNAYMLSGELATLLSGRYVEIEMLPLSFDEYISAVGIEGNLETKYKEYLEFGAFPYILELDKDEDAIRDYLTGIFNTIILKDVVVRKKVSDPLMLESVVKFMFGNIGNACSMKKISDTMTSDGRKITSKTVETYISGLVDSFIFYRAKRYDLKGKQLLKTNEKYYAADIGLKYFVQGRKGEDIGHILENVVYLELRRRGNKVHIGKVDQYEIDFIAEGIKGTEYYQVAASVRDRSTLERELNSLRKTGDDYPKYLITMDNDPQVSHDGIRQINIIDFLLKRY
ncbi:MAG TPA: ATPase [Clostridiales bacterium]|nr:MAG: ATPase [Clostridiales bacterium GWD2_32_59]HAN09581.1 ATPase [Clostridiales bacterium]